MRQEAFPQTQWSKHFALRAGVSTEQWAILDFPIRSYWKPVYCYLRRAGCPEEVSKDLVQDFFAHCMRDDLFAAADPGKGRFPNLLLKSLRHFHANARRAALAKKRHHGCGFQFALRRARRRRVPSD